jgi:hypothetical protein
MKPIALNPSPVISLPQLEAPGKTYKQTFQENYTVFMKYAKAELKAFAKKSGTDTIRFYKDAASKGVLNFVKEYSGAGVLALAFVALAVLVAGAVTYFFVDYCEIDAETPQHASQPAVESLMQSQYRGQKVKTD